MADVSGKFFSAKKVRTGVSPSSPGIEVGETLPPVNPPGGALNSVGLTMPSAFNVANSPLTSNGSLDVTAAGTISQYIRGDGTLETFPSLTGYVPYTGATQNVDLGEFGVDAGFVNLDTTPTGTPTTQGTIYWDDARSTAALIMNGTIQHIGQDSFFYVKNSTGSSINKGVAVRFDGTDGASGHLKIAPFLADGTYPSTYFMGVTADTIGNGEFGQVMHFGELEGINTSGFTAGDLLYASTTVAGGFQTTAPVAPNNIVLIAAAINSKNNGAIIVRPTYGSNINNDEGVKITTPTTGQLLQLQAGGLWENKTIAQVLGGTSSQFVKGDGSLDFTTYQNTADKGQPNGYASLDGNGKVPLTQINDALIGNVNFQGLWNASTNTPTLVDPPSSGTKGYYYIVSTGGTFAGITFEVGDWIISNGTAWGKVDNTDAVSSVFGRTGNVVASNGDYNTSQVTESGNLYYTDARSRAALSFAAGSGAYNSGTGVITIPTNNNQITNGAGYITSYTETDTLASVTGRGASTSTFSAFNGGLTATKTAKNTYGIQIKGAFYGAPRLQVYDLAADPNAYMGLGVDMSGAAYELSNYFPRTGGNGRWSVGSWAGDFGSGQYVSGYNEKLFINENAAQFNVALTVTGTATFSSSVTMAYGGNPRLTLQDTDAGAGNVGILFKEGTNDKWALASVGGGFQFFNETTSSNAIFITSGNNVGIGTASPTERFEVAGLNGNIRLYGRSGISNNSISSNLYYNGSAWVRDNASFGAAEINFGSSNDSIIFSTNSATSGSVTERMRITSSGSVGIGTNTPVSFQNYKYLQITGTNDTQGGVVRLTTSLGTYNAEFYTESSGSYLASSGLLGFYSAGGQRMTITSSGNVGIGTTSPSTLLHLNGTSTQITLQNVDGGTNAERIGMFMTSGDIFKILSLNDNNTTRVDNIITANVLNGNVGIGTASPDVFGRFYTQTLGLSSSGSTAIQINGGSGGYGQIDFGAAGVRTAGISASANETQWGSVTAIPAIIYTNGSERLRITSTGNVGIGTTSPRTGEGTPLTIESSTGYVGISLSGTGSYANVWQLYASGDGASNKFFGIYDRTNNAYRLVTTAAGSVLIGTTTDVGAKLYVDGGKSLVRTTDSSWGQFGVANPNDGEVGIVWGAGGTGYPGITSTYTRQWIAGLSPFGTGTDRWSITNRTLGANTALTIRDDGDTGIGTNSPASRLHLYKAGDNWHFIIDGGTGQLRFGAEAGAGAVIQARTSGGTTRPLYLQRDGANVLIGTTTDNGNRLRVNGVGFFDTGVRTGQPYGTTSDVWKLGRALVSGSTTVNRWIRVQIGNEYYDLLTNYGGEVPT